MRALLMHPDRDFEIESPSSGDSEMVQDLELNTLLRAMSPDDPFLFEVAKKALLSGPGNDRDTILYRQEILKDCLANAWVVKEIYQIAAATLAEEKKHYFGFFKYPSSILNRSVEMMRMLLVQLRKLRGVADAHSSRFVSRGLKTFFAMLRLELGESYLVEVEEHLAALRFRSGILVSAGLGKGFKGVNYILRQPLRERRSWLRRIFGPRAVGFKFEVDERDESGHRALSEIRDRGVNLVANALARSVDHILSFFSMLRTEFGFYVGCVNLHERLETIGAPVSFPLPVPAGERRFAFEGMYDVCLALTLGRKPVVNDLQADDKRLVIITGANQGGKSVFLRGIGLCQLMMQCGMYVPAEFFRADLCDAMFTHFKREEDAAMKSGKLDEELRRMSAIADRITPNSIVLLNESFAATNEREGSEIARQIVTALSETGVTVFFVTHLFQLARGLYDRSPENALFLRAERKADGGRTFKIIEGEPLQTSYGPDLFKRIFESADLSEPLDRPASE